LSSIIFGSVGKLFRLRWQGMPDDTDTESAQATWASSEIFPGGGNVENLLIIFRLLTMQCKLTFTKCITLSTPLVYAGCTSILHLLSKVLSTLRLSKILFLFISCPISIVWSRAANSHNLRKINGQNNTCGEKTKI